MLKTANQIADEVLTKMAKKKCDDGMPCEPAGKETKDATPDSTVLSETDSKIAPVPEKEQKSQKIAAQVLARMAAK